MKMETNLCKQTVHKMMDKESQRENTETRYADNFLVTRSFLRRADSVCCVGNGHSLGEERGANWISETQTHESGSSRASLRLEATSCRCGENFLFSHHVLATRGPGPAPDLTNKRGAPTMLCLSRK